MVLQIRIIIKAQAVWQWHSALRKTCAPGKPVLLINMDETSVAAFHGQQKGNVSKAGKEEPEPIQWASRQTRRTAFTHAAMICDDQRVQKKLPHLILANKKVRTVDKFNAIVARSPANVYIKHLDSAWMTTELTRTLIKVLAVHIKDELETHEVILIMDAARIHVHRDIWITCNRLKIKLIIVPAKMTWLLQPADVVAFALYKRHMRRCWQDMVAMRVDGILDIMDLFTIIFNTIADVLEGRCWKYAFKSTGFHTNFAQLSNYIMNKLEYSTKPAVNDTPPEEVVLKHVFPKNYTIPLNVVLKPFRPAEPLLALPAPPALPALPAPPAAPASSSLPFAKASPLGFPSRAQQKKLDAVSASQQAHKWQKMASDSSPSLLEENREVQPQEPASSSTAMPTPPTPFKRRVLPWTLRSQSSSAEGPK